MCPRQGKVPLRKSYVLHFLGADLQVKVQDDANALAFLYVAVHHPNAHVGVFESFHMCGAQCLNFAKGPFWPFTFSHLLFRLLECISRLLMWVNNG